MKDGSTDFFVPITNPCLGAGGHFCIPVPTNLITYRNGVLGQYWRCGICGEKTWEPVPTEEERMN